ncbi:MAG: histone-lysine N-methyltransferase [bacterium]
MTKLKEVLARPAATYPLLERDEPELLRDIFPYYKVPRIPFDYKIIPMEPPEEIWITDTTFRDGQQAQPPYTPDQIVTLFDFLHRMGGERGVIRQSEFFLYSDKDREAVEKCLERGYKYPEVTGWIRAVKEDFQLVKQMGLSETGILTSCSDYHIFLKLKKDRKKAMEGYLDLVKTALEAGITPRCHLEDITRADFYGFVIPFVQELRKLSEESGLPVKVRVCDTLGYGVSYPGAALPRSVPKLIYGLIHEGGVPSAQLEWHGHNDFHHVLINATTAWLYGCSAANGTLLGLGERTGNPPIEGLLIEYLGLKGETEGVDTTAITEMAEYFRRELKTRIPANYPFVGTNFNTTWAGIHADGALKDEEIYNIFDTKLLLNRPLEVAISDKSGIAGIAHWINRHLELTGDRMIDKRHPEVIKIQKWVEEQYKTGRVTSIAEREMYAQVKKHLPQLFHSNLEELKLRAGRIGRELVISMVEDPEIRSMDVNRCLPVMIRTVEDNHFIQLIYIVDAEGNRVTRNVTQRADRAKYENLLRDENFSDRNWFIHPIEDGNPYVTDFYTSRITGALCITVSAPIRDENEEIVGILEIDMKFEDLVKMEL